MTGIRAIQRGSGVSLLIGALAACGNNDPPSSLTLSTSSLTFETANTGLTPSGQIVKATVTGVSGGTLFLRIVVTGPAVRAVTDITITGPATGQALVVPNQASTLGAGSYTSTITVTACTSDINCFSGVIGTQTVQVTYNITGVKVSPSSLSWGAGFSPLAGDPVRQFSVTGFPDQNWTASVDVPWLSIQPPSGKTGGPVQVTATLVQPVVDSLSNGTRAGTITITPSLGSPAKVPVLLDISRTQANYISPYVGISGVAAKAIVRGNNFDKVTISGLKLGPSTTLACPSIACTLVSQTEIDIVYPALAAGTYPVQLVDNEGITTSFADLVVVDAPVFPAATFPIGNSPSVRSLAYDAERKAIVLGLGPVFSNTGLGTSTVKRFSYTADWVGDPPVLTSLDLIDVAMTPDGRQWLALGSAQIVPVDASTLAVGTAFNSPALDPSNFAAFGDRFTAMAMTNDGKAAVTVVDPSDFGVTYLFDTPGPAHASMSPFSGARVGGGDLIFHDLTGGLVPGGSADGSLVVLLRGDSLQYSAATGFVTVTGLHKSVILEKPVLDRNATRIAIFHPTTLPPFDRPPFLGIYDRTFNLLGELPVSFAAAFRPDPLGASTRVYTLTQDQNIGCQIHAFDLTSPSNGTFAEIAGAYPIPVDCTGNITAFPKMTITPDGGTLFIAGPNRVVVVPVP